MKHKTRLPRRRSIRLANYDYSCPGNYFVTLCLAGHRNLLGEIKQGGVELNPAGQMVTHQWCALPQRFIHLTLDTYIVMPNHFHGLINLEPAADTQLGDIIGLFKSLTSYYYHEGMKQQSWPPCQQHLWQRNYYEYIIRNDRDLALTREYIINNPQAALHAHDVPSPFKSNPAVPKIAADDD